MRTRGGDKLDWHLYILDCDGRLYTGIAKDPVRRLAEHRSGASRGARFTRASRNIELVYSLALGSHSLALRAEARVKKLRRADKLRIVNARPSRQDLLQSLQLEEAAL